jgi:hypothetical protein
MANLALVTAGRLYPVSGVGNGHEQYTFEASERINAGQVFRYDPTTGRAELANGSALAEAAQATAAGTFAVNFISELFLAIDGARQGGNAVTGMKKGEVDGFDLLSLAFGAKIYLSDTDGSLGDTVGTIATVIGRIRPAPFHGVPSGQDRILALNLPPVT